MIKVILVTDDPQNFFQLNNTISAQEGIQATWTDTGTTALKLVQEAPPSLVIADENLGDMSGLELASKMLPINPMVNAAVVSRLSHDDFHEASEGLGILAQLSPHPDAEQAEGLIARLKKILGLSEKIA